MGIPDVSKEPFESLRDNIIDLLRESMSETGVVMIDAQVVRDMQEEIAALTDALEAIDPILSVVEYHRDTWPDMSQEFWCRRLNEEMEELFASIRETHEHPPERELIQIASIAMNWLRRFHKPELVTAAARQIIARAKGEE